MGYQLTYKYYEEITKGEYNKEEVKTKTINVGSPYDEIPLENVAGKIIAQLARRNILVVDVEIYEFTKKKLSYKETNDGIVIKNKKFSFEDGACISTQDEVEENTVVQSVKNPDMQEQLLSVLNSLLAGQTKPPPFPATSSDKVAIAPPTGNLPPIKQNVLRWEVYNPVEKFLVEDAKKRGFSFTLGKKYPILAERMAGSNAQYGMNYTTMDDKNKRISLSDKFFTPIVKITGPHGDEEFKPQAQGSGDGLMWDNVTDDADMLDIRG